MENVERLNLQPEEQAILVQIIENGVNTINPKITTDEITYKGIEDLVENYGLNKFQKVLFSLTEKGYLTQSEYDRAVFCAKCGSIHLYSRFTCPKCTTVQVFKKELIEHTHCGYIGEREKFITAELLKCPNCGNELGPVNAEPKKRGRKSYTIIGSSFVCEKCAHNFERPHVIYQCIKCEHEFDYKSSIYNKLNSYELTELARKVTPRPEIITTIRKTQEILQDAGLEVEIPGKIIGESGVQHNFNIVARNTSILLVGDISEGEQTDLISLLGKKIDANAEHSFIIDMSGKIKESELTKTHNITILDAKKEDYEEKLKTYTDTRINPSEDTTSAS